MISDELFDSYLKQLTLLCVDDSTLVKLLYKNLFSPLFKEVLFAEDGKEALSIYEKNKIDVVITDYNMPNMNGIEMISKIREKDSQLPIILVSVFDNIDFLQDAIRLKVNNFIKKPFEEKELFDTIYNVVKLLMGNRYLLKKQEEQIHLLKKAKEYSDYQEKLSFQKELLLIRNDFYYRLSRQERVETLYFCDFLYRPLDTMSGDLYSARELKDDKELYFLVDGMGKGISASMSAMCLSSFINLNIDRVLEHGVEFKLNILIEKAIGYMELYLLEDEVISITIALVDIKRQKLEYASFGMPAILLMNKNNEVQTLASNNPPMNRYNKNFKSTACELEDITKILICSDGLYENTLPSENENYGKYIKEDFAASMTRSDFRRRIVARINTQEDDITFIFLNKISLTEEIGSISIEAKIENVENINEWYEEQLALVSKDSREITKASLALSELAMNAYEHGSLGITNKQKHQLLEEDKYIDYILKKEQETKFTINILIYKATNLLNESYIITKVEDEGDGFDTEILSKVFSFSQDAKKRFNGRGAYIARESSLGIYYNHKANSVYFINKL